MKLNHKHRYEIITQHSGESFVRDRFPDRHDILEVFTDLQDPILRADFIRYLVLLGDGGVYSDMDTIALMPIEDWIPPIHRSQTNIVIGIEYDRLNGARWLDWTLDLQFCTWTLLTKPGHPLMEMAVDRVMARLRRLALKQGTTISGIKASFKEVLDTTGPAMFTEVIIDGLSRFTGANFSHLNLTGLRNARLVSDVLILPINAFGSGQSHSNSGSPDEENALVQHTFAGSWKSNHDFDGDQQSIIELADKKTEEEMKREALKTQVEEEQKKQATEKQDAEGKGVNASSTA
ncbi:MAG: hypothetical protein LQ342_007628 [Letrouitia transgressa]|nr:MAG: hypothetical protein LQ342_007628 [Letrouitia transgressa]